jgi:hypothetical protein
VEHDLEVGTVLDGEAHEPVSGGRRTTGGGASCLLVVTAQVVE